MKNLQIVESETVYFKMCHGSKKKQKMRKYFELKKRCENMTYGGLWNAVKVFSKALFMLENKKGLRSMASTSTIRNKKSKLSPE